MPLDLHRMLYASTALIDTYSKEHRDILKNSSRLNSAFGITGFLHREGDVFVQVLEGPRGAVERTFARIAKDPRHRDVGLKAAEDVSSRLFPDWSMGYSDDALLSFGRGRGDRTREPDIALAPVLDLLVFLRGSAAGLR